MQSGAIRATPTRSSSVRRAASKSLPHSGGEGRRPSPISQAGAGDTVRVAMCTRTLKLASDHPEPAARDIDKSARSVMLWRRRPRARATLDLTRATMANEFRTLDSHSAEYFGDTRDHWWNLDFLVLMANSILSSRRSGMVPPGPPIAKC